MLQLLWCLVVDLIARLIGGGVYTQVYADNCLLAVGKFQIRYWGPYNGLFIL
jgi:hypothetical protein